MRMIKIARHPYLPPVVFENKKYLPFCSRISQGVFFFPPVCAPFDLFVLLPPTPPIRESPAGVGVGVGSLLGASSPSAAFSCASFFAFASSALFFFKASMLSWGTRGGLVVSSELSSLVGDR